MNRINNEYDKFIKSIAGTNIVDVIPHSTDSADVAAAMVAQVRAADSKLIADKAAADQAAADKIVADQAAADKLLTDQAAADKLVADQAAADKIIADKIVVDQAAADKAAADKAAADKAAADKIVADQAAADKIVADQAAAADKAAADKAAADQAAADKILADKAAADQSAADQSAAIQTVDERAIAEPSLNAAIIAAAVYAATRTIAPVSSTTAVQDTEKAATIDAVIAAATSAAYVNATTLKPAAAASESTVAEVEKSVTTSVIPMVNAESAVCTTQLVAACNAYYENARPNVAEITTDTSYEDEQQAQSLCGKHALNNLLRTTWTCSNMDDPYTTAELVVIKNENAANAVENYNKYLKVLHTSRPIILHKLCQLHNVFSGDNEECKEGDAYDMEVLVNALHIAGYNTTHTDIEVNARPTAVDTVLEILKTKPVGLILRTLSDVDSGHFIAIRKQLDDGNKYEVIDTLYTDSIDKTNNASKHAITTTDELKTWLNGAIYKHISNILVVHNFDGKYIPYNPAESSSDDTNMIFTDVDGKVYAYKYDNTRKMIDITDIICNQCKQDAKSQFEIADLYKCIQDFSDANGIDSGFEINNFKGYIPIYENDLNTIIKEVQRQDAAIPEVDEEQPKKDADIQIEAAELPGAVMPRPTQVPLIPTVTIDGSQRITNGLLILISHILKHKIDKQSVGQASTATTAESAQTEISKPSIKFDNIKYNDAVEKFKKNINREFADANYIEISPVTIDIDAEGNDNYILFGSFTAGNVKITRYNTDYDKQIEPKIPVSSNARADSINRLVKQQVINAEPATTTKSAVKPASTAPISASPPQPQQPQTNNSAIVAAASSAATSKSAATNSPSTPAVPPNNENYSAAIAAASAAIAAAIAAR